MLDDRVRLVGIAGAELLEYCSADLREPERENLGVKNFAMLGCVDVGCGQVEVGVLNAEGKG